MIHSALDTIRTELDEYLKNISSLNINNASVIKLCNVLGQDNEVKIPDESLGMTLINIEEERTLKSQVTSRKNSNGSVLSFNPEIKLNLYILISANFKEYEKSLSFISYVLKYFQSKYVFDHINSPSLDLSIEKLIVDLYTLTFEQQNYLWASLGAKIIPSVLYKIRMVIVNEESITSVAPFISNINTESKSVT